MNNMSVCLWFNTEAQEAMDLYKATFSGAEIGNTSRYGKAGAEISGQKVGAPMMVPGKIGNLKVLALNGGPMYKFTPSFSLTAHCADEKDAERVWKMLSPGGTVRMELGKYPWSPKYGWTSDKYGVEWQITTMESQDQIVPSLLFVDELFGRGDEALKHYTSIFKESKIDMVANDEKTKTIMYSGFHLNGQAFSLMEGQGQHGHKFSEATSITVTCKDQTEIDYYWDKLVVGGSEQRCGWLKDKFGVSWQIVPEEMGKIMSSAANGEKVMQAMFGMKRLDIAKLKAAAVST
ncbi:VOC family protein [soil metagenome]